MSPSGPRAAALLLACMAAPPAWAQPPASPAASRWHLDGATDRCVLTRELQGPGGAATFVLRTIPGSQQYDVILAGEGLERSFGRRPGEARIAFGGSARAFAAPAAAIELPGGRGSGVILSRLPATILSDFAAAPTLRLMDKDGADLGSWTIPIGAKAAQALSYCETEKQVEWGADRAAFGSGATPPRPLTDPSTWLTMRDFGLATAVGTARFSAVFRMTVDEKGTATDCQLIESAGNVEIAPTFCRAVLESARYEPARDPGGKPIRSIAVHVLTHQVNVEFSG
jgi:hypothetical protein